MPATRQPIPTPGDAPTDPRWVRELKAVLRRLALAIAEAPYAPDGVTIQAKGRSLTAVPQLVLHPWKIWVKPYSGGWKYAISDLVPGATGAVAGRVYKPDGNPADVTAVSWTAISATTNFWLKLSINEGTCTPTIEKSAPTVNIVDDPAILAYNIGTITFRNSAPIATAQLLNADVDLTGAIIPAWYVGYNKANIDQILVHLKNAAPSWFVTATQTYERIPKWSTSNVLGTLDAQTASTHAAVMSTGSAFTQVVYKDCDGNSS